MSKKIKGFKAKKLKKRLRRGVCSCMISGDPYCPCRYKKHKLYNVDENGDQIGEYPVYHTQNAPVGVVYIPSWDSPD